MRKLLPAFITTFISLHLSAQDFGWAIKPRGNDYVSVYQIVEDGLGYIYEIGNFTAELRNALGKMILRKELSTSTAGFDLQQVPSGIHFISLFAGTKTLVKKLVIGR